MKKNFIQLLLLCSLFFNIAHAIAIEDDCHHESAHAYVEEVTQSSDCGDLCDMHHLFHFMAIIDTSLITIETHFHKEILAHETSRYSFAIQKKNIKPPIA